MEIVLPQAGMKGIILRNGKEPPEEEWRKCRFATRILVVLQ
jgi:hypothetical protein